jgi:hypothetical protein
MVQNICFHIYDFFLYCGVDLLSVGLTVHFYFSLYAIYIYICVCVCERERERVI